MKPNEIRKELSEYLLSNLQPLGFKQKRGIFVRTRLPNIVDWIAIPSWIKPKNAPIKMSINIGIHYAPIMRIESDANNIKYSEAFSTFSTNIGYILRRKSWIDWEFKREISNKRYSKKMLKLILKKGIPYLEQFATLEKIELGLNQHGIPGYIAPRKAILNFLKQDNDLAIKLVERELKKFKDSDPDDSHLKYLKNLKKVFNSSNVSD